MSNAIQSFEMNHLAQPQNTYTAPQHNSQVRGAMPSEHLGFVRSSACNSQSIIRKPLNLREVANSSHLSLEITPVPVSNIPEIQVTNFDRENTNGEPFQQSPQLERGTGSSQINEESRPERMIKFNLPFFVNSGAIILSAVVLGLFLPGMIKNS